MHRFATEPIPLSSQKYVQNSGFYTCNRGRMLSEQLNPFPCPFLKVFRKRDGFYYKITVIGEEPENITIFIEEMSKNHYAVGGIRASDK